jgi:DNA-binding response OmpR family regulator
MLSNPRPRVLCVDDDEDSRVMLTTLLRLALIEAKAVGTAAEALSSFQTERFDLCLLDSRLPDLDGFELCRRLRSLDPRTPILFFSGAAHETDQRRGIEAGADAYLVKPDIAGLVGSITRFVGQPESPTAKIIPFIPKTSSSAPLMFEPAVA